MSSLPKVRCRLIEETDLDAVANLLTRGFPARTRKYWTNALARLAARLSDLSFAERALFGPQARLAQ
ncbi:MAG TPA: hypothetical protein VN805_17185 [Caulobacteraceae bacterium]|nr:hypothetical protein [Caulobacteraceae bacterium]